MTQTSLELKNYDCAVTHAKIMLQYSEEVGDNYYKFQANYLLSLSYFY